MSGNVFYRQGKVLSVNSIIVLGLKNKVCLKAVLFKYKALTS